MVSVLWILLVQVRLRNIIHPKFDLIRVQTHDLQIKDSTFRVPKSETLDLATEPLGTLINPLTYAIYLLICFRDRIWTYEDSKQSAQGYQQALSALRSSVFSTWILTPTNFSFILANE